MWVSKWLALAALAIVLWVARDILPPFVVAGVLAYLLAPLADHLAVRFGIRRPWAALVIFAGVVALIGLGGWLAGARLVSEVRSLSAEGPDLLQTIFVRVTGGQRLELFGQDVSARALADRLNAALALGIDNPAGTFGVARLAVEASLNIFLCLLALAYLLVDGHRLGGFLLRFVPTEHREKVAEIAVQIHVVLGRYLRGQLALVCLMAAVTFVLLEWLFRLPYALWIAILTGFLEVIPLLGPLAAGTVACLVGFSQGGIQEAGALAVMYFVLRQTEDQVVMPLVVGRAVHLHPLVTIFAVLAGERVAGVLGMLLAVPLAAAAKVVLDFAYPPVEGERAHDSPLPAAAAAEPLAGRSARNARPGARSGETSAGL